MNKSIHWNEELVNWVTIDDPLPKDVPVAHTPIFNEKKCRWDIIPNNKLEKYLSNPDIDLNRL